MIAQIDIEQREHFTLYNFKIRPGYLVCFPKLLQEYILQSTYSLLKIDEERKLQNLTF